MKLMPCVIALIASAPLVAAQRRDPPKPTVATPAAATTVPTASKGTLDRIRETGRIKLGYRVDARPFSYRDASTQAAGYSITLCERIVAAIKNEVGRDVTTDWVPVSFDTRFNALEQGQIDILCGADTETLERRARVSFSIPIFPGGIGVLVRADAPTALREVLLGEQRFKPTWRATLANTVHMRTFSAVKGTTTVTWLNARIKDLQTMAFVEPTDSYAVGLQNVLDSKTDAFFGERAVLLDAAKRHASARNLEVLDRLFTYEPLALACRFGDEPMRLVMDRALSALYASGKMADLYTYWFGAPDESARNFFRWNTLSE
jgi:ABC-type amino acid transport substrate-binding protein